MLDKYFKLTVLLIVCLSCLIVTKGYATDSFIMGLGSIIRQSTACLISIAY